MSIVTDKSEHESVKRDLERAIQSEDNAALARWAQKHGPGLMLLTSPTYRAPEVETGKVAAGAGTDGVLGAKFVSSLRGSGVLGEAAFRAAVAKLAQGIHAPLLRFVSRWIAKEAGLGGKAYGAFHKALASKLGPAAVAAILALLLKPFTERGGKPTALAPIVQELNVYAAQQGIEEGAAAAWEALTTYGPMLFEAVVGADTVEAALDAATSGVSKLRVVADALPEPAEEDSLERAQKQSLKGARGRR